MAGYWKHFNFPMIIVTSALNAFALFFPIMHHIALSYKVNKAATMHKEYVKSRCSQNISSSNFVVEKLCALMYHQTGLLEFSSLPLFSSVVICLNNTKLIKLESLNDITLKKSWWAKKLLIVN